MNINISGEVVRTSQLPKRIIGLGDYLVALNSSPLETSTVLVSDFVSFLNTQFATSLASLTDVSINGPLVGQALVYNGSQWVNQGIGELDTLDSVTTRGNTTTNNITVGTLYFGNGNHYLVTDNASYAMLSSNRTLQLATSGNPVLSVFTSQNVGIGTTTDSGFKLDVNGNTRVGGSMTVNNRYLYHQGASAIQYFMTSNAWSGTNSIFFGDDSSSTIGSITYNHQFDSLSFGVNGSTAIFIDSSRNIGIGTTSPTYKLEVSSAGYTTFGIMSGANISAEIHFQNTGYALPRWTIRATGTPNGSSGNLTFQRLANTFPFTITSGDNVLIGTGVDAGYKLDVNGSIRSKFATGYNTTTTDGSLVLTSSNDGNVALGVTTDLMLRVKLNPIGINFSSNGAQLIITGNRIYAFNNDGVLINSNITNTTSTSNGSLIVNNTVNYVNIAHIYNAQTINPTITGLAGGIARGIYINPTLTAAADFRAIETTAGKIIHQGLTNATHASQVYYNTSTGELTYGAAPVPTTPTLSQVTAAGNTTLSDITVGGINSTWDYSLSRDSGSANTRLGRFKFIRSTYNPTGVSASIDFWRGGSAYEGILAFSTNPGSSIGDTSVERMRITDSGNVLIGTTTDAGYKLDVNGTGRFSSTLTVATTASGGSPSNSILISTSESGNGGRISWGDSNTSILRLSNSLYFREYTGNFVFESTGSSTILFAVRPAGTTVSVGNFVTTGSITAASALARGVYMNNTLVAAANNDVLVGLDINPTFTNGAFTGVQNYAIRLQNSRLALFDAPFYSQAGASGSSTGFSITGTAGSNYTIDSSRNLIFTTGQSMYFNTDTDGGGATERAWYFAGARTGTTGGRTYTTITVDGSGFPSLTIYNNDNGSRIQLNSNAASYFNGGNLLVGTTTDSGYKLDVNGTTRVTSLYTENIYPVSSNINIWVNSQNSGSRFYFSPVHPDGRINLNAVASTADYTIIRAWHTNTIGLGTGSSVAGGAISLNGDQVLIGTSGSIYFMAGRFGAVNMPYRLGITTNTTVTGFHTGVSNNLTNIESHAFEFTAKSHTFFTGTTAGNQANPNQFTPLHLSTGGNVVVGGTTDAGYKLDVNGTVRVKGTGTTSSTTAFEVQNSISSTTFSVRDDGRVLIPGYTVLQGFTSIGAVQFYPVLDGGYTTSSTGRALRVDTTFNNTVSSTYAYQFGAFSLETGTASTINGTSVIATLAPTSGNQTFTALNVVSVINATGTYSGTVRGIFYNPVLTSMTGVTHRAIHTVTGDVLLATTSGNVGIGTTTPFGKLDIKDGEIFVTTSTNTNLRSRLTYQGLSVSRASDGGYPEQIISTDSAWQYHSRNRHTLYIDTIPHLQIGNVGISGLNIPQSNNIVIGNSADNGYKLQVNGNAFIKGSGTTSGTNSLLVQNGSGNSSLTIFDDRSSQFGGSVTSITGGFITTGSSPTNDSFYTLLSGQIKYYVSLGGYLKSTSQLISNTNGAGTINASAILQVDSTTQGFLKPRLTSVEKNAITTPATGLEVYDSTTNTPNYYNGTTWVGVASNQSTGLSPGLFAQTSDSTPVANTTVETTLISTGVGTLSVPANQFQVGASYVAYLSGVMSSQNNATLEIHLRSNGFVLADTNPMTLSATTGKFWELHINFTIRAIGAGGVAAIVTSGRFSYNKDSGNTPESVGFSNINNTTFDTTINNTLTITATWGSASPLDSIYTRIFNLYRVY